MPITIGSVQLSFFEGKEAQYVKPVRRHPREELFPPLFVANGFAFGV
jgi:hypothetical protein